MFMNIFQGINLTKKYKVPSSIIDLFLDNYNIILIIIFLAVSEETYRPLSPPPEVTNFKFVSTKSLYSDYDVPFSPVPVNNIDMIRRFTIINDLLQNINATHFPNITIKRCNIFQK